ncbi:MAG TPA: tetraacyldisaccharide 4'-kinase [Xanthobacteraceae bacterium]|nr:tetraacyldisaccharide 4'-kinase [Xanthobacteraceae bacterium]
MREPAFWWRPPGFLAAALAPLGALYGAVAARRMARRGRRARVPVICVGNLTLGGSGKTPSAIAVARMLQKAGERPAFLTRGYGGRLAGPVAVMPVHTAADVGDEPLLLARVAPTIVARDRVAGAGAVPADATVIVMDDGLQNASLAKSISVVVLDGPRGIGNGKVFPAGPLRAPLADQLARCQAVLVIGDAAAAANGIIAATRQRGRAVLTGRLVPDVAAVAQLSGRDVLAFAGIGNPEKFYATLRAAGIAVAEQRSFADHHVFTAAEAAELIAHADAHGLTLVTTEKDHARMSGQTSLAALAARSVTLPVTLEIDTADVLAQLAADVLHDRGRG